MKPGSFARIVLLAGGVLALSACDKEPAPDWRPAVIADAENTVRTRLGDPAARFSAVQVIGDQFSGQTCGYVTANPPAAANGGTGRFIVFIEGSPGYAAIERSVGIFIVSQEQFEAWWEQDCVGKGYKS